jgi:abhydrolase domain-containing protein 17
MAESLVRIAVILAAVYVVVTVVLWYAGERLIFLPQPASYRLSDRYVRLPTARGDTIAARYVANPQATYTIVFSHGNAEDLGDDESFLS